MARLTLQPERAPRRALPVAMLITAWALAFIVFAAILTAAYHFALRSRVIEPQVTNLAVYPQQTQAQLLRAVDGDTIAVLIGGREERVELIGVDAPELFAKVSSVEGGGVKSDWRETNDPLAMQAAQKLEALLTGKALALELHDPQRDDYGRLQGWVWLGAPEAAGSTLVNEWMLQQGLAALHSMPRDAKYAERMKKAAL